MRVFISWSKPTSRKVAEAIRDWLPLVIQQVQPWMSAADLEAGVRWGQLLSEQLGTTSFGIICLTPENLHEPWLHFEAGAISKEVENPTTRVIPLLFNVDKANLPGPLQQFQAVSADESGIRSIVRAIYACLAQKALDEKLLNITLDKWMPDLLKQLSEISVPQQSPKDESLNKEEAIREILLSVRSLARNQYTADAPAVYRKRFSRPEGYQQKATIDLGEPVHPDAQAEIFQMIMAVNDDLGVMWPSPSSLELRWRGQPSQDELMVIVQTIREQGFDARLSAISKRLNET
jgi:hypothetical protein